MVLVGNHSELADLSPTSITVKFLPSVRGEATSDDVTLDKCGRSGDVSLLRADADLSPWLPTK